MGATRWLLLDLSAEAGVPRPRVLTTRPQGLSTPLEVDGSHLTLLRPIARLPPETVDCRRADAVCLAGLSRPPPTVSGTQRFGIDLCPLEAVSGYTRDLSGGGDFPYLDSRASVCN